MDKVLTIFTPTYNRAEFLKRGYEALKKQSCKEFIWLIVDDGSNDNTKDVIKRFQENDNGFEIKYIYKENGGLHTGYNEAIANINTELSMCIDSDDWIAEDVIGNIIETWNGVKNEKCGGIVGLDADPTGAPLCHIHSKDKYINLNKYDVTHKWEGDRKLVVRTDLYKTVAPMPSFEGEKNFNPQYMHMKIAQDYNFYVYNKVICIVDYQQTGMSAGIFKQYLNSPNSFAEYRRLQMTIRPNSWRYILKNAIHYDSSCFLAKKPIDIIKESPYKFITTCFAPIGFLLSMYIKWKVYKSNNRRYE